MRSTGENGCLLIESDTSADYWHTTGGAAVTEKWSSAPKSGPVRYSPRMSRRVGSARTLWMCACVAGAFQFHRQPSVSDSQSHREVGPVRSWNDGKAIGETSGRSDDDDIVVDEGRVRGRLFQAEANRAMFGSGQLPQDRPGCAEVPGLPDGFVVTHDVTARIAAARTENRVDDPRVSGNAPALSRGGEVVADQRRAGMRLRGCGMEGVHRDSRADGYHEQVSRPR